MSEIDRLTSRFDELVEIEKERNELLKDLTDILGFDISFSDEQIIQNAKDVLAIETKKVLKSEVRKLWMK
jgi:deoxyinosine 3'endonuclease (endonuclease V)|tara:strand:- start:284 stop:493 length:210 start_codon:yes stop_codon:yes gene_type:complete